MITLLKKGGSHVWEGLDDYRPITLLNTELKILARVLANHLQLVICDLIGPEQTFAVKGRSIQDNLHLIREVLEGIKDDIESALISLDQSKAFDRVDHRFLASVLETAGFKPEFHRWISMMYHNPQAVVPVNGRCSRVFAIERSVRQGCPLSPLLYVLALEPLLRRLRHERTSPSLRDIPFVSRLVAKVSAFADDITVFAYLGRSLTGDSVWRRKASRTFPRLKSDPKAKGWRRPLAKHCLSASAERPFVTFLGPVTFQSLGKSYIGS